MSRSVQYVPYAEVGARPNIVVDGAALRSTVLTLSHWPINTTPEAFKRDTSTETALAYVERHDPARKAGIVTNNHVDEDGLFSMLTVLEPRRALARRELMADAARAGDFGRFRSRDGARVCFTIEAHVAPATTPLPRAAFTGKPAAQVAAFYRHMLPRLPRFLDDIGKFRRYWQPQERHLEESEALLALGRATVEEEPALDLAIVRIPEECRPRTVWRYLRAEQALLHPFAIHNATHCTRLVRIQGRRIELQYRYESWLQLPSRRPAPRVDLTPFCHWLNRRERNGSWVWENTLEIAPRLHLSNGAASSLEPAHFLRELRAALQRLPAAWDPYNWKPPTRRTR